MATNLPTWNELSFKEREQFFKVRELIDHDNRWDVVSCFQDSRNDTGFVCSLVPEHSGRHVAINSNREVVDVWVDPYDLNEVDSQLDKILETHK